MKRGKGRPPIPEQARQQMALTALRLVQEEQAAAPELLLKVVYQRVAKRLGVGTRALQLRLAEAPAAAADQRAAASAQRAARLAAVRWRSYTAVE